MIFGRRLLHSFAVCRVALFIGLLAISCSKSPTQEDPKLSIEPDKADFGEIAANDPIAFHYVSLTAQNLGRKPLTVSSVELPEGFDYEILPRKIVENGEPATLKLSIDIRKFSGPLSEIGYIFSNDPTESRKPITLTANIVGDPDTPISDIPDEPDIQFDHKAHDFGVMARNQALEHNFPFENIGKKTLKILEIDTRCLCATAIPTLWEIPPGGSAVLVAKMEAYKYPGTDPAKTLQIKTNDPDEPIVGLVITATIVDVAMLEPEEIVLPNVVAGVGAEAEAKLIQRGAKELKVRAIESSSPNISATYSAIEDKYKTFLIQINVAPDMPEGKFDERLIISTNYGRYKGNEPAKDASEAAFKDYRNLELPIRGTVTGAIVVTPSTLNFGSAVVGQSLQRKLTLSGKTARFEILSISVGNPAFKVTHSVVEPGKKYEIIVDFLPQGADRQIKDKLAITTNNVNLTVPVFASVKTEQ